MNNQSESKPWHCKAWLEKAYLDEELSTFSIGEMCGVSDTTIRVALARFGIKRRSPNRRTKYLTGESGRLFMRASKPFCRAVKKFSRQKGLSYTDLIQIALAEYMTRNNFNHHKEE